MKRDKYVKTKLNRRLAWDMKNKVIRMEKKKSGKGEFCRKRERQ